MIVQRDFYDRDTVEVSKDLIGKYIVRTIDDKIIKAMICETEAYCDIDQAAHCYGGHVTDRNRAMFGQVGRCYMYFIYGCHDCFNITAKSNTQKAGAVLIRSVIPVEGLDEIKKFRNMTSEKNLCNGPGKLCNGLKITKEHYGIDLTDVNSEIYIEEGNPIDVNTIKITTRIGITKDKNRMWRFNI